MQIIESTADGCLIRLKVVPGSSRSAVAGILGDRLKVKVAAAPEDGKANEAVCSLLARMLGVRPREVEVVTGHASPEKTLKVVGLAADQAHRLLNLV